MENIDDYAHKLVTYNYCESILAMENGKEILSTLPVQVYLSISSICNKHPKCAMCLTNHSGYFMTEGILDKVISEIFATTADIILTADGEPSIYPFLDKIGKNTINGISMQTNGIDSNNYELLISKFNNIYFSIDAATEDTYYRIRGDGFSTVIKNIKKILSLRKKHKANVFVRMDFVLMQCNKHEVIKFIELAGALGVDGVKINPLFPLVEFPLPEEHNGYYFDYKSELIHGTEAEYYLSIARQRAKELAIKFEEYNYE